MLNIVFLEFLSNFRKIKKVTYGLFQPTSRLLFLAMLPSMKHSILPFSPLGSLFMTVWSWGQLTAYSMFLPTEEGYFGKHCLSSECKLVSAPRIWRGGEETDLINLSDQESRDDKEELVAANNFVEEPPQIVDDSAAQRTSGVAWKAPCV